MTSFLIKAHVDRKPSAWHTDPECAFCRIISGEAPSRRVYEDDKIIAILDILPLRKGHTLVIPKVHYARISELPPEFAAALGAGVTKVAHALTQALNNTALNAVCNQEYAQAVPHVHYHIIPAPTFSTESKPPNTIHEPPLTRRQMHQMEFESRQELDDDDAASLLQLLRAKL
ncbi:HIT-like protein [Guyanagaster necrorhizus]|uniref:HIT-like protein n=1 Tax=Guyanagaster necrorhizus TaxID=856835 RepID=A0A9P7VSD5_9AGAR|nr:HIT-like protein [Guyanagaster necrorhizus MCA 3950]KAG7445778.1 HIT-like protein [Guyanagaster necrorhizus MCA 3950]